MGVDGSESQSVAAREALRVLAEVSAEQLAARRWEFQSAAQAAGVSVDEIGAVLNRRPELPRALLVEEREMLVAMLERGDFPGRDELLAQVETVEVVRYCACGCATVDLVVSGAEIPPGALARPIPNEALIVDQAGEIRGGILVFVNGGYLASLEVYQLGEVPVSPFPSVITCDPGHAATRTPKAPRRVPEVLLRGDRGQTARGVRPVRSRTRLA